MYRWAKANGIPVRRFAKGENKEQIARPLIEAAEREGGDGKVVLIGIAQEKTPMWRSWKAKGQEHAAHPHMEWGRQMGFVNHFYFYLWDPDWGGAFWKTNAYAPWPVWIWLNGHTWAQRQCERAGIGYAALDNGFRSCDDPKLLQKICDQLGSGAVKSFFATERAGDDLFLVRALGALVCRTGTGQTEAACVAGATHPHVAKRITDNLSVLCPGERCRPGEEGQGAVLREETRRVLRAGRGYRYLALSAPTCACGTARRRRGGTVG